MGRPVLGAEARSVKGTLRITRQEERALVEVHGSVGKGLRVLLDGWLSGSALRDPVEPMVAVDRVLDVVEAAVEAIVPADLEVTRALAGQDPQRSIVDEVADPAVAAALDDMPTFIPEPDRLHRHRRKTKIATEIHKGTKVEVWACECGAELR